MSNVIPFDFDGNAVRVLMREDDPWFVAKDICDVLEIGNAREAVKRLDDDELTSVVLTSGGQEREMNAVSESGCYALIFTSRKPEAKRFRKWVTGEVLPTIRKTGRFSMPSRSALPARSAPANVRTVKPHIRSQLIGFAVQLAKMEGGGEHDVLRYYDSFIELLAEQPSPTRDNSPVACWVDDECSEDPQAEYTKDELYAVFKGYCRRCGFQPMDRERFLRELKALVPQVGESRPRQTDGTRPRLIRGIRPGFSPGMEQEKMFQAWADDSLEQAKGKYVQAKHLYASFVRWCEDHGVDSVPSNIALGKWMMGQFERKASNVVLYYGIRLREA